MTNALQTKRDQGLSVHFGDKIQVQHLETVNTPQLQQSWQLMGVCRAVPLMQLQGHVSDSRARPGDAQTAFSDTDI